MRVFEDNFPAVKEKKTIERKAAWIHTEDVLNEYSRIEDNHDHKKAHDHVKLKEHTEAYFRKLPKEKREELGPKVKEELGPKVKPVSLQETHAAPAEEPSLWLLCLMGLFFVYLWWLAAILFDLAFIWLYYIRGGMIIDLIAGAEK